MPSPLWLYLQDGQSIGPIDEDDLKELFASSALGPSTPIRCSEVSESGWKPALAVPEFKVLFTERKELSTVPKIELTPLVVEQQSGLAEIPTVATILGPVPVAIAGQSRPVEITTSGKDAQSVVNWMWGLAFASWGSCFVPIPGISTFFVWFFASLSMIVALIALFKSRVGSGIAGLTALTFVTPAVWFFTIWLYAILLGKSIVDAEQGSRSRLHRASTSQTVQIQPQQVYLDEATQADPRVARAKELVYAGRSGDDELASLVEQGLSIDTVVRENFEGEAAWTLKQQICWAQGEKSAALSKLVRAIVAQNRDLTFSCTANDDPAWTQVAGSEDASLVRDALSQHVSEWSARNENKSYLNYVASLAVYANRRDVLLELKEHGLPLVGKEANFCRTETSPGSNATNNISTEGLSCYNPLEAAVATKNLDVVADLLSWGIDPNVMSEGSGGCKAALSTAESLAQSSEYAGPSDITTGKKLIEMLQAHGAKVRCAADWVAPRIYAILGSWQDQNSVCSYFSDNRLVCTLDGKRIERTWSLNDQAELEWFGGSKRYVYKLTSAYSNQIELENIFPVSARGTRWVAQRVERPSNH